MNKYIWIIIIAIGFLACIVIGLLRLRTTKSMPLTLIDGETTPLTFQGFDKSTIDYIKSASKGKKIGYLRSSEVEEIDMTKFDILKFELPKEKRSIVLAELKEKLDNMNYQVFYTKVSYDKNPELICILKSPDKYDILRALLTNGTNYDIDTDALITKLSEWDKLYGLEIIGADFDWVDVRFSTLPKEIVKFSEEIYEFCPDTVDQGFGSIEELVEVVRNDTGVFLWWD